MLGSTGRGKASIQVTVPDKTTTIEQSIKIYRKKGQTIAAISHFEEQFVWFHKAFFLHNDLFPMPGPEATMAKT